MNSRTHSICKRTGLGMIAWSVFLAWGSDAWAGPAGRFLYSFGEVAVTSSKGESRPAQRGQQVNEGDLVITGPDGSAQLRMDDNGMLAIRANSRVRIDEFRYSGKEDGNERSFFALLQGGFRAITGAIGSLNKQNYRIRTPTATIGIRGTDHEPFFVPAGPHPFGDAAPGTYDKVNTGEAYIETTDGLLGISPNQVGFAAGQNARPVLLPAMPAFFRVTPDPRPADPARQEKQGKAPPSSGKSEAKPDDSKQQEARKPAATASRPPTALPPAVAQAAASRLAGTPAATPLAQPQQVIKALVAQLGDERLNLDNQTITSSTGERIDVAETLVWQGGTPVVAGSADDRSDKGGPGAGIESGQAIQVDSAGRLLTVGSDDNRLAFTHGTALLAEIRRGSLALANGERMPVAWGRWRNLGEDQRFTLVDDDQSPLDATHFHYAIAPAMTPLANLNPAALGFAAGRYQLLEGTTPTTEQAEARGSLNSLAILMDFSRLQLMEYTLDLDANGRHYTARSTQPAPLDGAGFSLPLVAQCTGCTLTSQVRGEAEGALVGPKAEGIVTSYALGKQNIEYVFGAAVLALNSRLADSGTDSSSGTDSGSGTGTGGTDSGSGTGSGPGTDTGSGTGGTSGGTDSGSGTGSGSGTDTGSGTGGASGGTDSGSGTGSGSGTDTGSGTGGASGGTDSGSGTGSGSGTDTGSGTGGTSGGTDSGSGTGSGSGTDTGSGTGGTSGGTDSGSGTGSGSGTDTGSGTGGTSGGTDSGSGTGSGSGTDTGSGTGGTSGGTDSGSGTGSGSGTDTGSGTGGTSGGTDSGSGTGSGSGTDTGSGTGGTSGGTAGTLSGVMVGADMQQMVTGQVEAGSGVYAGPNIAADSSGNVTEVIDQQFYFSSNTAPLVESSTIVLDHEDGTSQKITWGRWEAKSAANTYLVKNGNTTKASIGSFHFARADLITQASALTALNIGKTTGTYWATVGTTPTSEINGESGHLEFLQATVDFSRQQITDYKLKVSFEDRWFKGSGGGVALSPTFTLRLNGDCMGCSKASPDSLVPITGSASGAFVGPKAEGMISSYNMQTTNGERSTTGVAVGQR